MNKLDDGSGLPTAVRQKLTEIRSEDRRVRLQTGVVRAAAILLTAMIVAMAIDWLAALHDNGWRWTLTLLALSCAAAAVVRGCLLPMLRSRNLASIAWQLDSAHPSLEERCLTLTEVAQSGDAPELGASQGMLEKVARQTEDLTKRISARSVVPRTGLVRAWKFLGGAMAVFALLFTVNFEQTRILVERFWTPGSSFTLTRLATKPGDITIGKGDDVTLQFTASGRATESAELFLRRPGRNEKIELHRIAPTEAKFTYAMNSVAESFEYRARSGDGQTSWHKVTVLDRPKISEVKMSIVPPAYSHLPMVEQDMLPRHVRALEGSKLDVSFKSDQPLSSMELKFGNGQTVPITESPDHTYHYTATLTNSMAFQPVFTNEHHLDNLAKPTCDVAVYKDQPPTVNVLTPKNEITARQDDKVKIDFEARDDFGLSKAELEVTVKGESNSTTTTLPIPLTKEEQGSKLIRKQLELDLAKFNLKQDQELSYVVRVTDTKENPAESSSAEKKGEQQPQNDQNSQTGQTSPIDQKQQPLAKQASQATQNSSSRQADSAKQDAAKSPDTQNHLAMKSVPPKPKAASEPGSKPPPNKMAKRVLDAGQCNCSGQMKIMVDNWGHSFEGQMREKLEIAIDPVLTKLDNLLGQAQKLSEDTLATGRSAEKLSQKQGPAMDSARDCLRQSEGAISELKKLCKDTPYAFISLQIDDIRETHISPARKYLGNVSLEADHLKNDLSNLEQGSFQIKLAREKLADLTRTYESIKRDNKLADAMQRLAKMHEIFLEDTQAMLGSSKPALNPQQRKIAEVSDEFAEKYRKLLEEKKKIMAELSKILANDPRLLRRFMALEELDGQTLRDQMTVLADRQRVLAKDSAQWTAAADKDRDAFLKSQIAAQAAEQGEVAELTGNMLENMVTWVPMDVPVDKEPIAGCRKLAADAARLAAEAAKAAPESIDASLVSASNALEQIRRLQAKLPGFDWISSSTENVSAFEANRLEETGNLITRESGWIKKMQALRAGDFAQAAEVDQHRLLLDTTTLGEKLETAAISAGSLSPEIKDKAEELIDTMKKGVLPEESKAEDALSRKTVPGAVLHQTEATNAFAEGERQFDDLLHLIIAKLDAEPPPTETGSAKSLEEILAMLKDEKKACEKLGVPCRPLNIHVEKDWMRAGSCPNPSSAQARAAQAQARQAKEKAERNREKAKQLARQSVKALPPVAVKESPKVGPKPAAISWNTLGSKLGEDLQQGRDNVPPEQYRQAIEQYFSSISEKAGEAPAPAAP